MRQTSPLAFPQTCSSTLQSTCWLGSTCLTTGTLPWCVLQRNVCMAVLLCVSLYCPAAQLYLAACIVAPLWRLSWAGLSCWPCPAMCKCLRVYCLCACVWLQVSELLGSMTPDAARLDLCTRQYEETKATVLAGMPGAAAGSEPWFNFAFVEAELPAELRHRCVWVRAGVRQ